MHFFLWIKKIDALIWYIHTQLNFGPTFYLHICIAIASYKVFINKYQISLSLSPCADPTSQCMFVWTSIVCTYVWLLIAGNILTNNAHMTMMKVTHSNHACLEENERGKIKHRNLRRQRRRKGKYSKIHLIDGIQGWWAQQSLQRDPKRIEAYKKPKYVARPIFFFFFNLNIPGT